ncbi:hypothetical protein FOFC_03693 [Fusarium oxysporum]|nr:hypothetical protein FOFC_03693 [Fusarium oxysporum]
MSTRSGNSPFKLSSCGSQVCMHSMHLGAPQNTLVSEVSSR